MQTWTSDRSKALWLRDAGMLPKAVPNARILTWGYNADVHAFLGHTSSNRIMQHAHTLVAQLQTDREVCLALTLRRSLFATSQAKMLSSGLLSSFSRRTDDVFDSWKVLLKGLSSSCAIRLGGSLSRGYLNSLFKISQC